MASTHTKWIAAFMMLISAHSAQAQSWLQGVSEDTCKLRGQGLSGEAFNLFVRSCLSRGDFDYPGCPQKDWEMDKNDAGSTKSFEACIVKTDAEVKKRRAEEIRNAEEAAKAEKKRRASELRRAEEAAKAAEIRMKKGGVRIGMTKQQVLDSSWGPPSDVRRTITATSVREQWSYGSGRYLYFDNGTLTTIQD